MAYRIVNEVDVPSSLTDYKDKAERGLSAKTDSMKTDGRTGSGAGAGGQGGLTGGNAANSNKMDEDEERDAVFFRLEMLGYRVGQGLVER